MSELYGGARISYIFHDIFSQGTVHNTASAMSSASALFHSTCYDANMRCYGIVCHRTDTNMLFIQNSLLAGLDEISPFDTLSDHDIRTAIRNATVRRLSSGCRVSLPSSWLIVFVVPPLAL